MHTRKTKVLFGYKVSYPNHSLWNFKDGFRLCFHITTNSSAHSQFFSFFKGKEKWMQFFQQKGENIGLHIFKPFPLTHLYLHSSFPNLAFPCVPHSPSKANPIENFSTWHFLITWHVCNFILSVRVYFNYWNLFAFGKYILNLSCFGILLI